MEIEQYQFCFMVNAPLNHPEWQLQEGRVINESKCAETPQYYILEC